ncbi:MAG: DUF255 domain-containing protein, partial [Firmicutes bacterium]|nr:DUF255 domain-containing protein [Bacillota bacterium]
MSKPFFRFSPRPNRAAEIHWQPWDAQVFAQAQAERKPVLLSISAVWCHWCHVMDETTYSTPEIINRINAAFIPIRVDNDQRPDINQRYNMGGWPTTAFLSPHGEILTGGTFFSPEQMASVLDQVLNYWNTHQEEIGAQLAAPAEPPINPALNTPESASVEKVIDALRTQFDRAYGGIGIMPKFPQPDVWEFALSYFAATGDGSAAGMVVRTLDVMAGSAIFDGIGGGFFRYSTSREWNAPHFEKLLEDNALMILLYLHSFQLLGDESYRQVAAGTLQWANQMLLNDRGLWRGSQDADEEYYQLPPEEREKAAPPAVDPLV